MHTIRLRGPWQLEPLERYIARRDGSFERVADGLPVSSRLTMPADWSSAFGAEFCGRVRYHRVFQSPTGLDSGERVWLVVEPPRCRGGIKLNGKPLGDVSWRGPNFRFDITDLVEDHNRLEIVVEHPALDGDWVANDDSDINQPGGLVGEVRLEIEE
ncbi:MAG TPA: hypothetical protein VHK01_22470 [Lacipirellulaceae bacterium]|jgi:hypothetical protein|nr:hypothetical protein [Lacipirellulaceae bacterium]